jgi:hypothetical protein
VERHTAKSQLLPGGRGLERTRSLTEPIISIPLLASAEAMPRSARRWDIACARTLTISSWTHSMSSLSLRCPLVRVHAACQARPHGPPHLTGPPLPPSILPGCRNIITRRRTGMTYDETVCTPDALVRLGNSDQWRNTVNWPARALELVTLAEVAVQ